VQKHNRQHPKADALLSHQSHQQLGIKNGTESGRRGGVDSQKVQRKNQEAQWLDKAKAVH